MLDVKAFGSPRAQAWAQRINNAQNTNANKGFDKAGDNHPDVKKSNKTEYSQSIKNTAPTAEGSTQMKSLGSLGTGLWSAVG